MRKTKFLYLPIEVKPRELDAKLLIALEACRRGYSVIIGTKVVNSLLHNGPKGIYFYKDASAPLFEQFKYFQSLGHKIVVHDEEGLVQQSDADYLKRRVMFPTVNHVNIFFCWGTHQADLINRVKKSFKSEVKVKVVGHPRFDLLRMPFKNYNATRASTQVKTILINTKLAECNHQRGENGWLDLLKSHQMLHSKECLSLRNAQIEYKKNLFKYYEQLIKKLSFEHSECRIVVRPHPSENITTWQKLTYDLKNVEVVKQHNIGYWLNRSDVVIHTGCTTAIESYASGLPAIAFKPIFDKRFEISLPNEISITAKSVEHCSILVGRLLSDDTEYQIKSNEYRRILKPHIKNISDEFSYKKIVDSIEELNVEPHCLNWFFKFSMRLKELLFVLKPGYFKYNHRDISEREINETLSGLCDEIEVKKPIIRRLKKNVYLMKSK
ncbi:surface carbohydrate biosynthesis protein [Methylophaga sp.]|uniref:surface carbohydrate biosynthesis protein n=1 Tax=Methylophaga sp. TaxID=2024840 RepID=UPI003A920AA0